MITLVKRMRFLFIICVVAAVVLCGAAIFLLNVTDDGSTTSPAIAIFSIAGVFVALALFDLFRPPNALVLYNPEKRTVLVVKRKKTIVSPKPSDSDSKYYEFNLSEIKRAYAVKGPEGGTKSFGAAGYLATVKSVNAIVIKTNDYVYRICNASNLKAADKIKELMQNKTESK